MNHMFPMKASVSSCSLTRFVVDDLVVTYGYMLSAAPAHTGSEPQAMYRGHLSCIVGFSEFRSMRIVAEQDFFVSLYLTIRRCIKTFLITLIRETIWPGPCTVLHLGLQGWSRCSFTLLKLSHQRDCIRTPTHDLALFRDGVRDTHI